MHTSKVYLSLQICACIRALTAFAPSLHLVRSPLLRCLLFSIFYRNDTSLHKIQYCLSSVLVLHSLSKLKSLDDYSNLVTSIHRQSLADSNDNSGRQMVTRALAVKSKKRIVKHINSGYQRKVMWAHVNFRPASYSTKVF